MPIISIVGTSGVGKSFLVKQLSALDCCPAFFEGEEGVIPNELFKDMFGNSSPVRRWKWFRDHYGKNLELAKQISATGVTVYTDGALLSFEAFLPYEKPEHLPELTGILNSIQHLRSDITILLTASQEVITNNIQSRGRSIEDVVKAAHRALEIQKHFIQVAQKQKNVITVDRSLLDFTKNVDLLKIKELIRIPSSG